MGKFVQKRIGIIGAGNLGTSLALSLKEKGYDIVFNSSFYNNEIKDVKNEKNIEKFLIKTELIFITVKDKDIKNRVNLLKNHNISGKTIIHFSGFYSSEILYELKQKGATIGSFHPIISIPEKYININDINEKLYASFEGENIAEIIVKDVFKKLNFIVFKIYPDEKILFHLYLTLLSNYPFYIIELGKQLLVDIDIDLNKKEFIDNFIETSVKNYLKTGKISGPLSRGDFELIEEELKSLKNEKLKKIIDKIIKISYEIKTEVNNELS